MDRKFILGLAITIGGTLLTSQAHAYSTSLVNFPIADILKAREALYTFGAGGYAHNVNKGYSFAQTVTFGVLDQGEIGVSNDFLGHTLYDGKVQLFSNPEHGVAVSLGVNRYDPNA